MASKFGLAGGIPERRVRPIWDAIDSRQFKNALKHSTSLLAKCPNSPYALALKSLILERMGKSDEALSVCLNAKDLLYKNESLLMDDLTLSTLQIVFQRLDRLDLATGCYEYACSKFPSNLDLMMGLFNCYVREYSFVKQQQTAIKMYKLVGEERFLLWAVCSIQLQVFCGNGGEKLAMLAEGLLKKHVASHSLHEPEALIVYISILEQQARCGDALEILSGKLGSLLIIEVDKLRIQGRLLARSGDYATGADIYEKILELCPDDWECFLHYLGCLLEDGSSWSNGVHNDPINPQKSVDCKVSQLPDEVFHSRISTSLAFVKKLQADTSDDFIRCPYLAILEIERRKQLHGKGNDDDIVEALMLYFLKFGHLASFSSDVEAFLQVLSPDKKTEFLAKLMKTLDSPATVPTKALGQSITIFKIQELTGNLYKLPVLELESCAVQMVKMYCKSLPLSKDLDPQESMHGEELLSMVCNVLVQLFWRTRHLGYFIEAIMVLEFGLTIRRYIWQYKILLLHLYSHLGVISLAYEWYKSLDMKNILMETVSHHILPQMLASPLWGDLNNLLKDYLKFMDDHFRESADLTFLAYRHRNYSKVIEFVQFKERLQRSNQYLVARVETSVLQLKQKADNIEEEEDVLKSLNSGVHFVELSNEIGSKTLTFNEDFHSRPWWTPTTEKNYLLGPFEGLSYCPKENLTKEREENVRRVVEKKSLLPRMIYLSIHSASASLKESVEENGSKSGSKISSELKFLLEHHAKMLGYSLSDAVEVVMGVSSGVKSFEAFGSDEIDWINFAVFLNAWNLNSHEPLQPDRDQCGRGIWHVVDTLLVKYISEKIKSMESLVCSPRVDLPILVQLVTEPLAWHGLVIQSCVRSSLPSGKKKKKGGSMDQHSSLVLNGVRDSIQSLCDILKEVAKWIRGQIDRPEDESVENILSSLRKKEQDEGPGRVFHVLESLIPSINEAEHGGRICQELKTWSALDVARKIVTGDSTLLSQFLNICESKIKSFQALKQQIAPI
ncbi:N-TERMINAL ACETYLTRANSFERASE-RELATED [Salix purpurea]|uniref:N-TERMINAL ACETYLTRANSFERASE-RELATED n=1 Tax=Salix purpurea TaxID=77065 RepID=A0A9Q0WAN6_SALPP|nr:N-TERMINAL ACETYLTRANSFERASE-RELATED [Salix purpurea]